MGKKEKIAVFYLIFTVIILLTLASFPFLSFTGYAVGMTENSLQITNFGEIITKPGEKKSISITVQNTGINFLNKCNLKFPKNQGLFIKSSESKGISPGEKKDFPIEITAHTNAKIEKITNNLTVICDETNLSKEFTINIIENTKNFDIIDINQKDNILTIDYQVLDNSKLHEFIDVQIIIKDNNDIELEKITDSFYLESQELTRTVKINLKDNTPGIYYATISYKDSPSEYIKKSIILGESETSGDVILGNSNFDKILGYIVFIVVILIVVIFSLLVGKNKTINNDNPKIEEEKKRFLQSLINKIRRKSNLNQKKDDKIKIDTSLKKKDLDKMLKTLRKEKGIKKEAIKKTRNKSKKKIPENIDDIDTSKKKKELNKILKTLRKQKLKDK